MSVNNWIHAIIFIAGFIFQGIILSYRAKRKKAKR